METKTRPHLVHSGNGEIAVHGGIAEAAAKNSGSKAPKLSARPPGAPTNDR
jgi:type II secretory pathway component HofQ